MLHEDMKAAFADAVSHIVSNISQYAAGPGRDFTRSGKKGGRQAHLLPGFLRLFQHQDRIAWFLWPAGRLPIRHKDEFRAFCDMADRLDTPPGTGDVFIGDRGYCSYNNMAHVVKKGQYFLFRTKDIHSKGLVGNFDLPDSDSFDITVDVTLVLYRCEALQ